MNPAGIATAVKHCPDEGSFRLNRVVNGIGESFREKAVETTLLAVDTGVELERIYDPKTEFQENTSRAREPGARRRQNRQPSPPDRRAG